MTELERKALLGDPEAQKQCTEQGIILSCPFCGRKVFISDASRSSRCTEATFECGSCDFELTIMQYHLGDADLNPSPLAQYNTRVAPPIGKCKDCQYTCPGSDDSYIVCVMHGHAVKDDGWCNEFEPKEPNHGTL